MTAAGRVTKATVILLIQPISFLQYGQAAYPAKLSFGVEIHREISTSTLLIFAFAH